MFVKLEIKYTHSYSTKVNKQGRVRSLNVLSTSFQVRKKMSDPPVVSYGFATWNVRTLNSDRSWHVRPQLCTHMVRKQLHLVFATETRMPDGPQPQLQWCRQRWTRDAGKEATNEWFAMANSAADVTKKNSHGVGFVWRPDYICEYFRMSLLVRTRISLILFPAACDFFTPVSPRLCYGKFRPRCLGGSDAFIAVCCYAPTDLPAKREDTDVFYQELNRLVRELKDSKEFRNHYFYIAGDFNATLGDEETLFGWANIPSRPRFGRLKSSHNGEKLLQFCRDNKLCIMNWAKRSRPGDKETWAHPNTGVKSCKDYMLTFKKESAQIRFVRATGHWNERWFTDHRPLTWRLDTQQGAFRPIKPKSLKPEARALQSTLTPPVTNPAPSTPNPTPRTPSLPGYQTRKRKQEPPCYGKSKIERRACGAKFCEGFKQLRKSTSLLTAEEIISAAKKLQNRIAISSTPAITYPSAGICRLVVFEIWAAENPQMRDPKVPSSTKRALASAEAKRLNKQRNRAMLKSIVLYTNEVGITDPEAMKRLKDFLRTLKPEDVSCDQTRPSDLEFVFHLGQLFSRDQQSLRSKFRVKHLRRFGQKFPVVWQVNRPLTLKEVKRGIRESSTGTAPVSNLS